MKTFARHITLDELKALCAKNGWKLDTTLHDQIDGSDFVTFYAEFGNRFRAIIYSPWNGHFIVPVGNKKYITERSPDGAVPWLDDLLNVLFTNEPRKAKAA